MRTTKVMSTRQALVQPNFIEEYQHWRNIVSTMTIDSGTYNKNPDCHKKQLCGSVLSHTKKKSKSKSKFSDEELIRLIFETFYYKEGRIHSKYNRNSRSKKDSLADTSIDKLKGGLMYRVCTLKQVKIMAHRVAFCLHFGVFPKYVDHVDRDGLNNKIENLRQATSRQNAGNSKLYSTNTSGVRGIFYIKRIKRWKVFIGKFTYNKTFLTKEEAIKARKELAILHFGEFFNE